MKLWLDDIRPAPIGWTLATHAASALQHLLTGQVIEASLDHDLGWCDTCSELAKLEGGIILNPVIVNQCPHVPQGSELAKWMVEQDAWPKERITIHSWNPDGARRMANILSVGRSPVPIFIRPYKVA